MALLTLACVVTVFLVITIINTLRKGKQTRLPKDVKRLPGPRGLPFIGSVHELPEKNSWTKFHQWGEQYGPIYQVNLAGVNHVWISRDKIAHDLLAKRSAIYSDRPFIPALQQDNRTSGQYLPLMSQNELWSRQRKFAKHIMDVSQKSSFFGYPELESVRLLFELISDPGRYSVAMESFISRITCRLAWGAPTASDELKQRARELLIGVSPTGALGNKLPFIMSLPERLIKAKAWESRRTRTERKFFETMQQEVEDDKSPENPTWMRSFLDQKLSWGFGSDLEGAYAVGMHGIAGALTIAAPMQSFCLAMCHYPQYQPMLHEEIDRVLGDRMPTFADMPDMPVLRAFIRETLRWRPPVPTGIPHQLIKDDVYEGYHIPAGSVMHPLEWSISRDPEVFLEPEEWNPMRWLDSAFPTYQEPLTKHPTITQYSQFGYGRRLCQGMAVTEANLFVGLGGVAWLFSMNSPSSPAQNDSDSAYESEDEPCSEADYPIEDRRVEQDFFEQNAARIKRQSSEFWRSSSGADQCISVDSDVTMHLNDSAIDLPLETGSPHVKEVDVRSSSTLQEHITDVNLTSISVPGSYPLEVPSISQPSTPSTPSTSNTKGSSKCQEPYGLAPSTMNFSTLLIAKPLPFKFNLQVRNMQRAEIVARKWLDHQMAGEFKNPRVFWGGGKSNTGTAEFGWGEVFA